MGLIVVSGAIANKHQQGGEAWVRLSYLLGLRRLGFRVYFIEQIAPTACVASDGSPAELEASANLAYFRRVMDEFGLADCATLIPTDEHGRADVPASVLDLAAAADVLLNVSGHLAIEPLLSRFRRRVFIDIDPGFTQFWFADGNPAARLAGHDWFFTIGENIGRLGCSIPTGGIHWRPTRPPVVLAEWPLVPPPDKLRFTTVANWRGSYGAIEFAGQTFGAKVHEFRKVLELPALAPASFEIALNIHPADQKDLNALRANGWRIVDPVAAASTPARFRTYIQASSAEFSVAQGVYVSMNCGWLSDRTIRYLASGRPALVQDTGFSRNYPVGAGLIPFRTLEEADTGARAIAHDYATHAAAACSLAESYFDSDRVLGEMLEQIGVAP